MLRELLLILGRGKKDTLTIATAQDLPTRVQSVVEVPKKRRRKLRVERVEARVRKKKKLTIENVQTDLKNPEKRKLGENHLQNTKRKELFMLKIKIDMRKVGEQTGIEEMTEIGETTGIDGLIGIEGMIEVDGMTKIGIGGTIGSTETKEMLEVVEMIETGEIGEVGNRLEETDMRKIVIMIHILIQDHKGHLLIISGIFLEQVLPTKLSEVLDTIVYIIDFLKYV